MMICPALKAVTASADHNMAEGVLAMRRVMKPNDVIARMGSVQLLCALFGLGESATTARIDAVANKLTDTISDASLRTGTAELKIHDSAAHLLVRARNRIRSTTQ